MDGNANAASPTPAVPRAVSHDDRRPLFLTEPRPLEAGLGAFAATQPGVRSEQVPSAIPRSLAAADFNGDGVSDLLVGHTSPDGAFVTLHPGDMDYLFPGPRRNGLEELDTQPSRAPFRPVSRIVKAPVDPDFLGAGDFDADGHNDFVIASRAQPFLYWFRGDGEGGFSHPAPFELDGRPVALLVSDLNRSDGLADVAVALSAGDSAAVWVLEGPDGALRSIPEKFPIPDPALELTAGNLDSDLYVDLAAALPGSLLLIHGRDRMLSAAPAIRDWVGPARVDEYPVPAGIRSILAGDFVGDPRQELAVLLEDSSVRIVEPSDDGFLRVDGISAAVEGLTGDRLAKGRFSPRGHEQLVAWSGARTEVEVLLPDQTSFLRRTSLRSGTIPVQLLPMRLDPDALSDLVLLGADDFEISVAESGICGSGPAFVVNDPGSQSDYSNDGICDVDNNPSNGEQCTFRGALAEGSREGEPFRVSFAIPGPIEFAGEATQPVCIDGGSGVEGTGSVRLSGGSSVVRGLHFLSGGGIEIQGENNFVEGNRLDNTGISALSTSNTTIGGSTDEARNVVGSAGISVNCMTVEPCPGNQILGNFVGTDETGEDAAVQFAPGAGRSGVYVYGNAAGTLVRNNVIAGYNLNIWIDRSRSTLVQGNRIGTNRSGTRALFPEATFGVSVTWSQDDLIGGTGANLANLISGHNQTTNDFRNEAIGVYIGFSSGTKVQGNRIGTDLSGQNAIPNGKGIAIRDQAGRSNPQIEQKPILIGGEGESAGNLLSGNLRYGLELTDRIEDLVTGVPDVQVMGNSIGTDAEGTSQLSNESDGLRVVSGIKDALISANVIAYNGGAGVGFSPVSNATGVSILENSIHSNEGLGIDLTRPGVNANDEGDSDTGANNGQNYPELHLVTGNEITWSLDSPAGTYRIEFFSNTECDTSSVPPHGEGQVLIGSREESISPGQVFQFPASLNLGTGVSATATAIVNGLPTDTSEFSECKAAVSDRDPLVVNSLDDDVDADLSDPACSTGGQVEDDLGTTGPKCTLRAAIQQANANSGTDRIEFKVPSREFDDGLLVISPASALPAIEEAVTLDAYSQPGSGQGPGRIPIIVLDGHAAAGNGVHGFTITGNNSEITGFVIQGFSGYGISISGPGGNRITGNLIGTDADGRAAVPNQAGGIEIDNSPSNTIGGTATVSDRPLPFEMPYFESNVISGNTAMGILLGGSETTQNRILGNLIGPTSGFDGGVGNRTGIMILGGASGNTVGPRNTISANSNDGVLINTGARENRIVDNAIGVEISRLGNTVGLGNGKNGIRVDNAAANTIGGLTTADRNIVSGNAGCGIVIEHGATQNKVLGNFIGTDHQGIFAVPNGDPEDPSEDVGHGILLNDAPANQIGGLEEGATNVISGNYYFGVAIRGVLAEGNVVQGNHVGVDITGTRAVSWTDLRVQHGGVLIGSQNAFNDRGAPRNTIGGEDPAARNLLSGNRSVGIAIQGPSAIGNKIQGNYIGIDVTGRAPVVLPLESENGTPRQFIGLEITDASGNLIGGGPFPESGCVSPCNVISGNDYKGIAIGGSSTENEVLGNVVGTVADGSASLQDPGDNYPQRAGVALWYGTSNNRIGKTGQGNLISGNRDEGIDVYDQATSNRIEGNRIGTDRTGTARIGNGTGIDIGAGSGNRIGGLSVADGNLIAWNRIGVEVSEGNGNSIRLNSIFENQEAGIRLVGGNPGSVLPQILSASSGARIWGTFFRTPSIPGILDFYSNPPCPGPGECDRQGRTYLGSLPYPAGATRFDLRSPVPLLAGQQVTATATDSTGSTSGFSLSVGVSADQDGDGAPDSFPGEDENNAQRFSTGNGTIVSTERTDLRLEGNPDAASPTSPTGIRLRETLSLRISGGATSPQGLTSTLGLSPGGTVTLTVHLPAGVEATTWYNFGPTPNDETEHWYEFLFDGTTGAEILADRILLHFVDGERGDHDLTENGVIETSGGPSIIADLYFPFFQPDPTTFVGIAVSNFSDDPANLIFRALGGSGADLDLPNNPVSRILQSETQLASLASEIFGAASFTSRFGWVVLNTDNPRLGSFFQFGDASRLDGSVAVTEPSGSLWFTRVFEGGSAYRGQSASTQIVVANPGSESASVTFRLKEPDGSTRKTSARVIAPRGVLSQTVSELFGLTASAGYIEAIVTDGPEITGFQRITLRNQNTTVGLAPAVDSLSNELFSAQLASTPGLFTSIKLINTSSRNRTVTLTATADNGDRLADPVSLTLAPGESLEEDASALFAPVGPGATSSIAPAAQTVLIGSMRAVSEGPGLVGDVMFGDSATYQYAAALPLQSVPFQEAVFSQFANLEGFFTGLAFLNPGLTDAQLTIDVVRANGEQAGHAQLELPAGERLSKLVVELAPETDGEAGGYVLVRSDQPILAQLLFGAVGPNGQPTLFSAVPPTAIR